MACRFRSGCPACAKRMPTGGVQASMKMVMRSVTAPKPAPRRGFLTMELALTLPILGLLLFALFEFSLLFTARSSLVEASRAGARKAALAGAQPQDVETEVRSVLKRRFRRSTEIRAELGRHSGDDVSVTVSVPMTKAAPNLLWPIGYSLEGRNLQATTHMTKE